MHPDGEAADCGLQEQKTQAMRLTTTATLPGRLTGLLTGACVLLMGLGTAFSADEKIKFNRDILPILADKCFHCHGPDEKAREADLRLDIVEGSTADLGGYAAIVPGDP